MAWQVCSPNNIILGVVGDFDSAKMEARLREAFASWPKGPKASDAEIKPEPAKPGYYQIEKTDVNQSQIQLVATGITREIPTITRLRCSTKPSAEDFLRACSATSARPKDSPTASAAESARAGITRACCG